MKLILKLKFFILILFFILVNNSYANQFSSINVNSLNIAKTNEIFDFLKNKVAEGIFFDQSNFVEIFLENGDFQVEFINGQYKGIYRGKWKAENNSICFKYDNSDNSFYFCFRI